MQERAYLMFEQQVVIAKDHVDAEIELSALESVYPSATAIVAPSHKGFELPRLVWLGMFGCYAVFFAAITAATGGSARALFAIAVSIIYTAIYFGVARIGAKQAGNECASPLNHGKTLQTWTGPMDAASVYGQILIVPFAIAFFGLAMLIVTSLVS